MTDMLPDQVLLTIAVICKNEAGNIARCLDSLPTTIRGAAVEILVVDSFSTDETVEIARCYPVKIIQLGKDWPHSPAAGRYTAVNHAHGQYLLLIDGDMELLPDFVDEALAAMRANPNVVAVRGRLHNYHRIGTQLLYCDSKFAGEVARRDRFVDDIKPVPILSASGSALFRLQAVKNAGNFHPFLKVEEEFELCERLRNNGSEILYLPVDAVNHYGYDPDPLAEVKRRLQRGLVGGFGQMIRVAFKRGNGWYHLGRFRLQLGFALLYSTVLPAILLSYWEPKYLGFLIVVFFSVLAVYCVKKSSYRGALAACLLNGLIGFDILRGLFKNVPSPSCYPTDVSILKQPQGEK